MINTPRGNIQVTKRRSISSYIVLICVFTLSLFSILPKNNPTTLGLASPSELADHTPTSSSQETDKPWGLFNKRSNQSKESEYAESSISGNSKELFAYNNSSVTIYNRSAIFRDASVQLTSNNHPRAPPSA